LQALQLHGKTAFSFHANNDEINEPAVTTVHLTFSPTMVQQEIGREFDICAKKKEGKSHTENTSYTDSGCGMKTNLILKGSLLQCSCVL